MPAHIGAACTVCFLQKEHGQDKCAWSIAPCHTRHSQLDACITTWKQRWWLLFMPLNAELKIAGGSFIIIRVSWAAQVRHVNVMAGVVRCLKLKLKCLSVYQVW